jgi:hypothetical protein
MKRILIVLAFVTFISSMSSAQFFQYGIKAGLNYSSLSMNDVTISTADEAYDLLRGDNVRGYQAGLQTRIKVAMIFIQPELYFNVTGGTVDQVIENSITGTQDINTLTVKYSRIDIPLLVGVKLGPARVNVGPVGSAVINSVNELQELSSSLDAVSTGLTWGFQAGVGIDLLKKLTLDGRFEGSLSKYADDITVAGNSYTLDARPRQWIIAVGWWF